MTLQPIKDMNEFKRIKESLKSRFEAEKTGEQALFIDQSKLLEPLINVQKQTTQELQKQTESNQDIVRELQRQAMYPPAQAIGPPAQLTLDAPRHPLSLERNPHHSSGIPSHSKLSLST